MHRNHVHIEQRVLYRGSKSGYNYKSKSSRQSTAVAKVIGGLLFVWGRLFKVFILTPGSLFTVNFSCTSFHATCRPCVRVFLRWIALR